MISVLSGGMFCSIQDKGRFGFRHLGMPVSGVMDSQSAGIVNLLLDNDENDAVLEIGLQGPRLQFEVPTWIALTGAPKKATLNGVIIDMNRVYQVNENNVLHISSGTKGVWTYLGVNGGFQNEVQLKSRSGYGLANLGIHKIVMGAKLQINSIAITQNLKPNSRLHVSVDYMEDQTIKVKKGPEYEMLSDKQKHHILNHEFTIGGNSSRMAYYLNSDSSILSHKNQITTAPVNVGTVQLPPSGIPMILMNDCQTTGGYPRVLQVVREDLIKVAQRRIGSKFRMLLI